MICVRCNPLPLALSTFLPSRVAAEVHGCRTLLSAAQLALGNVRDTCFVAYDGQFG